MVRLATLTATVALGLTAIGSAPTAQAAPLPTVTQPAQVQSAVEHVQYRRSCRRWHRECRARWGFGLRFQRCMARRGC